MVAPVNNLGQPKKGPAVSYLTNSNVSGSLLDNPNYGKLTNRRPNTNYNINVHYSTNLTHPELASQSPVPNPVSERTKTLSPVQQISVIGRGKDPSVNIKSDHVSHYVRVKEKPVIVSKTIQQLDEAQLLAFAEKILGPFIKAFIGKDKYTQNIENLANNLLDLINQFLSFSAPNAPEPKYIVIWTSFPNSSVWYTIPQAIQTLIKDTKTILNYLNIIKEKLQSEGIDSKTLDNLIQGISQIINELSPVEKAGAKISLKEFVNKYNNVLNNLENIANELLKINNAHFIEEFDAEDLAKIAEQVEQITGGLPLTEIFQLLGFNTTGWIPHNNDNYYRNQFFLDNSSISISGNTIYLQFQLGSGQFAPGGGSTSNITTQFIEITNVNGYVVIKYTTNHYILYPGGNVSEEDLTTYYVINSVTKQIIYQSSAYPVIIAQPPAPTQGDVVQPSQVISNVLQQYGYQLTQQELQEIDNLQPGQSITVNASAGSSGAQFKITYLGNNQYQIQSVNQFYNFNDFNNPWTSINETIIIPTYSINQQTGQITTTNLQISGQATTYGTTNINEPYYNATYKINETIPINYMYNTQIGQLTFWAGNIQGGATLQSINAPTLTAQQYMELANGKMPSGVQPYTWYYYPILHEFVYVAPPQYKLTIGNTQITNQEVINFVQQYGANNVLITNLGMTGNPNELAFIYVTPNGNGEMLIYNTVTGQVVETVPIKNLQTGNPNYDLIAQMTYNQQYKTYSNEIVTFNLGNTNSSNSSNTSTYLTVDLINNTVYLENENWQILSSKQFSSQQDLLTYLDSTYGITPYNVYMAVYPPLVTNTSNISAPNQTIFNPSVIKNIITSSSATSSNSYLSSNISSIIANTIPGTTINYLNYKPPQSINIDFWTIWNNIGNTLNNVFETLFGWGSPSTPQISTLQTSYITGVITPPLQFPSKYVYQNELSNIQFMAQEIEQNPLSYYSGAQGGIQLFDTLAQYSASIAQTLANWGLQGPSQFFLNLAQSFLNLEQQAQIVGTPANIFGNIVTVAKPLASLALIEYFGPEEGATAAGTKVAMPTLGDFAKSFILQGSAITGITNAISYFTTGKLLSPEEDIFLFTTGGLTAAGASTLGSLLSRELTDIGITGFKNKVLTSLTQNVIAQAGINTEVQEALSLQNNGKWLSPSEAKQAAISGAEMALLFVPIDLFMSKFSSGFFGNPLFSSLAAGTTNALFMLPSGNPELIASAFGIGFVTHGLDRLITFSKIPYLLESPEAQRVLDTTEAGWRLEKDLKERMVEAGLVTEKDTLGLTTTQTIQKLKEIYNNLQEKIIEKELSSQDKMYLRLNGILGIRDDVIQGKEEDFAKYVRDKVPDGERYYQAQQILKDLGKKLDKMFRGFKVNINLGNNQRTLFYFVRSGDEYKWGFGSAGKEESFISRRSVSDITLNVAGIYNTPSDVIDTIKYLRSKGMYDDAEMLDRIYNAVRSIKDILSKIKPTKNLELEFRDYAEEFTKKYGFEYGELISTQMGDTIKEYLQENFGKNAVIYGSESVRQYLDDIAKRYGGKVVRVGKYYVVIDRYGNTIWKFRMPGDVDVIINTKDPGVLEKAAEDIAKLLNKTLNTNRFVAQEHLVIDKYRDGEHVVDLHMPDEGSEWKNVYARLSNFNDLGFPRPEPYYTDNVGVANLSQTLLDKASAVASLRQLSLHDIVEAINRGEKIDNPQYVISFLKNLLKDADYETQRNVLSEFIGNLNPGRRNIYLYLISKEFGIPIEKLNYIDPNYWNAIFEYFYKTQTYIAPATYRLKDTGDTSSLIYLGGKLTGSRNVMKDYERIEEIAKEKGILEKDWTEPNEINMEDVYKMLNPFKSNTESTKMVRVGSVIGPIGSLFESSITKPSSIASISSSSSISNRSSSIASASFSTSRSAIASIASSSLSSSLTSGSLSSSISSSTSNSTSLSPSISASVSSSLSSSLSQSLSTSTSTSTSTSPSLSPSTSESESVSVSVSTSNPWQFAFLGIRKPKHESPTMKPELGRAKKSMSDAAYAFYRIWR